VGAVDREHLFQRLCGLLVIEELFVVDRRHALPERDLLARRDRAEQARRRQ